jgi:uncharacterized membrane protein YgcG
MPRSSSPLLYLVLALLAACGDSGGTPAAVTPGTLPAMLDTIDPSRPDSLFVPEMLIAQGRTLAPALYDEIKSAKLMHRWAAAYYFSRLGQAEDTARLADGMADENESVRTVFAATLLRLGDARGMSLVQAALQSKNGLIYMRPPRRLADYASATLVALHPTMQMGPAPRRPGGLVPRLLEGLGGVLDVSVDVDAGCQANATLNLQFSGTGANQALIDVWVAAIQKMWSGQTTQNCCQLRVKVNTKLGGAVDPTYAQIDVVHMVPGAQHRSNMTLGSAALKDSIVGSWDDSDTTGSVAAHECGHAMGVDDEYMDTPMGSVPAGPAVGEPDPSIMAQTWANPEGIAPVGKDRHAIRIAQQYGAMCPESCIESWAARTGRTGGTGGSAGTGGGAGTGGSAGTGGTGGSDGPVTTPDAGPTGPSFKVSPIVALFSQPTFSTTYDIMVSNPAHEALVVEWDGRSCGSSTPMGPQPTSVLEMFSADMTWSHPHPPCDPSTNHAGELIKVTVTGSSGSIVCTYQGAETGRGSACSP